MKQEKPWAEPFQQLIEELRDRWGGEIRTPDRKSTADLFFYPELQAEVDGVTVIVAVSEFAGNTVGYLAAADNIEYLRIELLRESPYSLVISPEWLRDRLLKFVGLKSEFETGDKTFDRKFLLNTNSEADERLLGRPEFRGGVVALGQFAQLSVQRAYTRISRTIIREEDLAPATVRDLVERLLGLAHLCR